MRGSRSVGWAVPGRGRGWMREENSCCRRSTWWRSSSSWARWSTRGLRLCFFFQAEDGIRDLTVTGVQTCALPICTDRFQIHARRLPNESERDDVDLTVRKARKPATQFWRNRGRFLASSVAAVYDRPLVTRHMSLSWQRLL